MRASAAMHRTARANATQAFSDVVHAQPTANELRFLLALSLFETTFGSGWDPPGDTSNNMGAIQGSPGFSYEDTHPTSSGGADSYVTTFRIYPTPLEGWRDLVREMYLRRPAVRTAARSGNVTAVARELKTSGYYEGKGATDAERIANYASALSSALAEVDSVMNGPSATVNVVSPDGRQLGTAQVSDAVAPGFSALSGVYGMPFMIAHPNGWRFLQFTQGLTIPAKSNLPYQPLPTAKAPGYGAEKAALWLGVAGLVATVFYGTLSVKPGRLAHAR